MLFGEDAGGEGVGRVVVEYGDGCLGDDRAGVYVFGDDMDGAAGDLDPGGERVGLWLGGHSTRKGGEQRGVDVDDAIAIGGHDGPVKNRAVTGVHYQLYVVCL